MLCLRLMVVCVCFVPTALFGEERSATKEIARKVADAYCRDYLEVEAVLDRCLVQWSPSGTGQDYGRPHPLPNRYSIEKWVIELKMSPNAHFMRVSTVREPEKVRTDRAPVTQFVGGVLCVDQTVYEWGPTTEIPATLFEDLKETLPRWGVDKYRMESVSTRGGETFLLATYSPPPLGYESSQRLVGTRNMTIPCAIGCPLSPCFSSWVTKNGRSRFVQVVVPQVENGIPILPQQQYDINDPGHIWVAYDKLADSDMDRLNRTLRSTTHISRVDPSTGFVRQLCKGKTAFMGDLVGNYDVWHFTYNKAKPSPDTFRLPFDKTGVRLLLKWKRHDNGGDL